MTWGIPPELDRTILSGRRRLEAHALPATRYSLTPLNDFFVDPGRGWEQRHAFKALDHETECLGDAGPVQDLLAGKAASAALF